MKRYQYDIFADYFQIDIESELSYGKLKDIYHHRSEIDELLSIGEGYIVMGTVRNMTVPFRISILNQRPEINIGEYDQINECCINIAGNQLLVSGGTDGINELRRIPIEPGMYRALLLYKNLGTLSEDGLEGDDSYEVFLWADHSCETGYKKVIKQRKLD